MANTETVSIRDLRLRFRAVKRKLEEIGQVVITDNGVPSYELRRLATPNGKKAYEQRDYLALLMQEEGSPSSEEATKSLFEQNRGDR